MEMIAKMLFAFLKSDPQMRAGVFKTVGFFDTLDARLARIEEALNLPPYERMTEEQFEQNIKGAANGHAGR